MEDAITALEERLVKVDSASPDGTHTNPNIGTLVSGLKELAKLKGRQSKGAHFGINTIQVKPSGVM